jgi:hypothetical protein
VFWGIPRLAKGIDSSRAVGVGGDFVDTKKCAAKDLRPARKSAKFPRDFNIARNTAAAQRKLQAPRWPPQ